MTYSKYKIRLTQTETIKQEDGRGEKKKKRFLFKCIGAEFY